MSKKAFYKVVFVGPPAQPRSDGLRYKEDDPPAAGGKGEFVRDA